MATYLIWKNNVISMVRGDTLDIKLTIIENDNQGLIGYINKNFEELVEPESSENPVSIVGKIYHLEPGDKVYFGLMRPNDSFEKSVIVKYIEKIEDSEESGLDYHGIYEDESGNLHIRLDRRDTELLYPGDYYYTVKVERFDETVETVVYKNKFLLID